MTPPSRGKAELALTLTAVIWGTTFVVVKRSLDDASALLFVAMRFTLAAVLLAAIYRPQLKERRVGRGGLIAGLFLFGGYAFQTAGLRFTGPAKAAFLTGLFVVMVPMLAALVYRVWPHVSEALGILVATAGMGLMTLHGQSLRIERGDTLILLCAVSFAAHTLAVAHFSRREGFAQIGVGQVATTAALAWATFWWLEAPFVRPTAMLAAGVAITAIFATGLALTIQAWAQQFTTATRAALIFAVEPVVAWITSYLIAGESFLASSAVGAALILAGVLLAELKPIGPVRHPSR